MPRNLRQRKQKIYEPIQLFSLQGRLALFLKGGNVERPGEGFAHWIASGLGVFAKQVEKYTLSGFLEICHQFLVETRLENILLVEVDYHSVYQDKKKKSLNDLSDAFTAARQYVSQHASGNKLLISSLGKTRMEKRRDLHLTAEIQYYRQHGLGKPGIELRLAGIPTVLLPKRNENKFEFKARESDLAKRLQSPRKLAEFRKGCENTLQLVLRDYEAHLSGLLDVDKTEKQFAL